MLGVYPSALHVRWTLPRSAPAGLPAAVAALAVADEPTVFWDGRDAEALVDQWKVDVGFRTGDGPDDHGYVRSSGNGTSGRPVRDKILSKLGLSDDETWFTDAVDHFFVKRGGSKRQQGDVIDEVYDVFAAARQGLLPADLPARPTVDALIDLATTEHRDRLRAEIVEARAPVIVTLGEEARRVLAGVTDRASGAPMLRLTNGPAVDKAYGEPGEAIVDDVSMTWFALAHPGNRDPYWAALHTAWGARRHPKPPHA